MADTKLTALTADTSPTSDDITYVVNDPAGTPASRKVTLQNVITKAHGLSDGVVQIASGAMTSGALTSPVINTGVSGTAIDTDTALASNSDTKLASQKATKTYVDTHSDQLVERESGQYYSMRGTTTTTTALSLTATGVLSSHPVFLQAGSYDRISVITTVAAVSTWRFGVYPSNPSTGKPDGQTLILDCGTIDMNSTAGLLTATISLTIPTTGVYWLAVLVDSYTATPTVYGWTTTASGSAQSPLLGAPVNATAATAGRQAISRYLAGVGTGSMPATYPASAWAHNAPRISLRAT